MDLAIAMDAMGWTRYAPGQHWPARRNLQAAHWGIERNTMDHV